MPVSGIHANLRPSARGSSNSLRSTAGDMAHESASRVMQAPPLHVVTNLTTEQVQGRRRNGQGKRLDANGFGK